MTKAVEGLTTKEQFEQTTITLFGKYLSTRLESFEEQLSKLQTIEE